MAKKSADTPASFEQTLEILEQLVDTMEQGDISLEESMAAFEKGIALTRQAQKALSEAEQKVQMLTEQDGEPVETPFHDEDDS